MKLKSIILWSRDNVEGHKGGECCERRTIIHKSAIESTTSHKGANNGKIITKGDGDGTM
jgi:hypothetical protein